MYGRKEALQILNLQDFRASMKDVFSTTVNRETIDEAPMAYKPMDEIVNAIQETVLIELHLKPIYDFKAGRD